MKADIEKLFLDSLINSLPDNIYFKDRESRFLMINRALAERFGLKDPSEALGKTDADFFDSEHARNARYDELQVMQTGKPIIGKEEHETTHSGLSKWVLTTKLPLHDTDGQLIGTFGVSRDVTEIKIAQQALLESEAQLRQHQDQLEAEVKRRTEELSSANERMEMEIQERKNAEKSLRISEERYRRLLQVNPTYIYTVTIKNKKPVKTEHGPGCVVVTGYMPEEYEANPNLWIIMVHPEDRELVKKFVTEDLTQRDHQNQIEHRIIHKDGRLHWVRNTIVHHYDDDGELTRYDGLVEDITARKYADDRQRENERLSALSTMANGVVSNYSRIVETISKHASSILQQAGSDSTIHSDAEAIMNAAEATSELNQRLKAVANTYSHQEQAASPAPVRLGRVVAKARKPLKKMLRRTGIAVRAKIPSQIPNVNINEDQLLDVLNIMLVNAYEAMPNGGTITVSASTKLILRSSHRWNQTARGGRYLILRVSDTGTGMDKETVNQVFDSFFSTKRQGSFGLGLAMAQAAVKSWGGWIRVRSRPNEGATFRVFIPVYSEKAPQGERPKADVTLRGKTALVIDDNEQHAAQISAILQADGMSVLTAHNDTAAMHTYASNIDRISLCVLDMLLGDGDWGKTLSQLYKLKPESNVIVISGFSRDFVRANLPVGAWSFLQKPVEASSLLQLAAECIAQNVV